MTALRRRAYDRISAKVVELDDTMAAEGGRAEPVPDTEDAASDPRRLGVATQERVRLAVHERVFGAPRDPVKIGRYTVLKRIGQGGMGVVYAAYDTELDRKVALKLLHGEGGDTGERLTREAKALAKLSHPSIVAVHEVGVHDGNVFVAMEFVDGETLREHVLRHTLDWRELVALYVQAGRGLAAAHAAGLVHRDFKPDNALVADAGDAGLRVRVLDFGLARDVGDREAAHPLGSDAAIDRAVELTRTGTLLGTPAYMAPEQYVGTAVDAYADQFAFCVSLWEAIYRERPFDDTSVATVAAAIMSGRRRPPPAGSRVPLAL
ncbi:MAG TPA: serine/threonine-protein kinase, partial [Nannocystaceae bacterium]|nr:serine/threonine-protein kinase [Nannocystaceae bacterium]